MSMHKIPLTPIEESGLRAHGLDIGKPSQLSDAFRQGVRYARAQLPSQGGEAVEVVARIIETPAAIFPAVELTQSGVSICGTHDLMTVAQHQRILLSTVIRCEQKGAFKICLECGYQDGHDLICQYHESKRAAVSDDLTNVRCLCCQSEHAHNSYDAGFIAGSGMCQSCDSALPAKDIVSITHPADQVADDLTMVKVPREPTMKMRRITQDKLASEGVCVSDWMVCTVYSSMIEEAEASQPARTNTTNLRQESKNPGALIWILFDDAGFPIFGTARSDKPPSDSFALRPWVALAPVMRVNQCAEVCERAKLCAICSSGIDETPLPVWIDDPDAFVERLKASGWVSTHDAQWTGAEALRVELRAMLGVKDERG